MQWLMKGLQYITGGFFDSLFGWLERRRSIEVAIQKDRAEMAVVGMLDAGQRRDAVNKAMKEALSDPNPNMSDWN